MCEFSVLFLVTSVNWDNLDRIFSTFNEFFSDFSFSLFSFISLSFNIDSCVKIDFWNGQARKRHVLLSHFSFFIHASKQDTWDRILLFLHFLPLLFPFLLDWSVFLIAFLCEFNFEWWNSTSLQPNVCILCPCLVFVFRTRNRKWYSSDLRRHIVVNTNTQVCVRKSERKASS